MSFPTTLVLVLLASYGLCNLLLSVAVGALWRAGGFLPLKRADALLALRLLPAAGSALAVLTVVLPAFLLYEPAHADDKPGALLVVAAGLALLVIFDGIRRAARAARAARCEDGRAAPGCSTRRDRRKAEGRRDPKVRWPAGPRRPRG